MKRTIAATLAAVLTLGSLTVTALPATASGQKGQECVAETVSSQKNRARPTLNVVKNTATSQSMRVGTTWHANQKCVEYQWATNDTFTKGLGGMTIKTGGSKPGLSRVVGDLPNNTKIYFRGRVIDNNGVAGSWSSVVSGVTNARTPNEVTASWKKTSDGRVTISWKHDGAYTKSIRLHLAVTPFNPGKKGKKHQIINVPVDKRSYTLTAAQLKKLGTQIGSGRTFRFRVEAQNSGASETRSRYSKASIVAVAGQPNKAVTGKKTTVKIASYNIVSTRAEGRPPSWNSRRKAVASTIVNSKASIVGLQEASTNKAGKTTQVKQLLSDVKAAQKKKNKKVKWNLVRSTRYIKPGQPGGDDGARILYDSAKYKLLSKCSDKTKKADYSTSCAIKLPRVGGVNYQRSAAVARFQDKKTKQKFWVVSAHLEHRKGAKYNTNRRSQVNTIFKHLDKVNKAGEPVFLVGDLNSSSARTEDYPLINRILDKGYYDAATAAKLKGQQYSTFNEWKKQSRSPIGHGARIDFIFVRGANTYATQYTNVINGRKASDHNLIHTTVQIKR